MQEKVRMELLKKFRLKYNYMYTPLFTTFVVLYSQ